MNSGFHRFLGSGLMVTALTASCAWADTVTTDDGSRFVGTIETVHASKLTILTEFAGLVEIDMSRVTGIATDSPVSVTVNSGDTLVGVISMQGDSGGSVVQSALGEIPIQSADITHVWPAGTENPEIRAARQEVQAQLEAAKPDWQIKIEAGATREEGNTDTLKGHGRLDVTRKTNDDLLHFYLAGQYAEEDDARTTNEYFGGMRYENMLTERWYWYTRTELEYDEFENIDLRATAAAGAGYYWIKQDEHELKTSAGAGYRHEAYGDGRVEDDLIVDLGLDYRLDLTPWLQFTHSSTYSPAVEDLDDYRLKFDTALLVPFKDDRLAWKLGMTNEYNSRPQAGYERLDNTYYTSLVFTLKQK